MRPTDEIMKQKKEHLITLLKERPALTARELNAALKEKFGMGCGPAVIKEARTSLGIVKKNRHVQKLPDNLKPKKLPMPSAFSMLKLPKPFKEALVTASKMMPDLHLTKIVLTPDGGAELHQQKVDLVDLS